MSLLEAVVLGVVQGVTEFLPISSTAHLRIVPALVGWPDAGAAYTAVIQLGTVAAVLVYFRRDVWQLGRASLEGLFRGAPLASADARLGWSVVLGTIPIVVLGLLFRKSIEGSLRSLYVVAASMILLAGFLFLAERLARHRRTLGDLSLRDGLLIGLCQSVALIPGSSRSGTTLTGGLALGLRREDAARYSFLLSIPATAGAGLFELRHVMKAGPLFSGVDVVIGTAVAFATGMLAIAGLLRYLRTRTTGVFIVYRLLLGALLLALLGSGRLSPDEGASAVGRPGQPSVPSTGKQIGD